MPGLNRLNKPVRSHMKYNLPYIDHIWRVRSAVSIDEQLSPSQGFERMSPLFRTDRLQ